MNSKKQVFVICGFPGVGKSYVVRHQNDLGLKILDSDSSTFDKKEFPQNYIEHIESVLSKGEVDIILVSSHKVVREALKENNIDFFLVYPDILCKDEYIERYQERGSPESFIDLLRKNWDNWITECKQETDCSHVVLKRGQTLYDWIEKVR